MMNLSEIEKAVNGYNAALTAKMPIITLLPSAKLTRALHGVYIWGRNRSEGEGELYGIIEKNKISLSELFDGIGEPAAETFFGVNAPLFRRVWKRSFDFSYSEGCGRRSLRGGDDRAHFQRCTELFRELCYLCAVDFDASDYLNGKKTELGSAQNAASQVIAAVCDESDAVSGELRAGIAQGRNMDVCVYALVYMRSPWAREALGELLLSAGLQEGARQAVAQAMDEGDIDTFKYLLGVIRDNNLQRFAAVLRGFDVWCGLPLNTLSAATAKHCVNVFCACMLDDKAEEYINSENPVDSYLALFSLGCRDMGAAYDELRGFLDSPDPARRTAGYYWLSLDLSDPERKNGYFVKYSSEPDEDAFAFLCAVPDEPRYIITNENRKSGQALFDAIHSALCRIGSKNFKLAFPSLPEFKVSIPASGLLTVAIGLAEELGDDYTDRLCGDWGSMNADSRSRLIYCLIEKKRPMTPAQRKVIIEACMDKSSRVRECAFNRVGDLRLTAAEYLGIEATLSSKAEDVRKTALTLLLKQPPEKCLQSVLRLAASDDGNIVDAARALVTDMERRTEFSSVIDSARAAVSSAPAVIRELTYEVERLTPIPAPAGKGGCMPRALPGKKEFLKKLEPVYGLLEKYADEMLDIEPEEAWQPRVEGRFGSLDVSDMYGIWRNIEENRIKYPFLGIIYDTFRACLTDEEIFAARFFADTCCAEDAIFSEDAGFKALYRRLYGKSDTADFLCADTQGADGIIRLLTRVTAGKIQSEAIYAGMLDTAQYVYANTTAAELRKKRNFEYMMGEEYLRLYGTEKGICFWLTELPCEKLSDDDFTLYFNLCRAYTERLDCASDCYISAAAAQRAFDSGLINGEDIKYLLTKPGMKHLMRKLSDPMAKRSARFTELLNGIIYSVTASEATRGEAPTKLTGLAAEIQRAYGCRNFALIVENMTDRSYVRGYCFSSGFSAKGETLSQLLKCLYPDEGEGAETLEKFLPKGTLPEKRLIEAAMYAPAWLGIVGDYLGVPGLKKAGLWFHAHMNEEFSPEKQKAVAAYSGISPSDFAAGAFDAEWYRQSREEVGEKYFKMLYDSAKYIAGGSLHKRSQLFVDASEGKLDGAALADEVMRGRNKDRLLAYSLIAPADDAGALEKYLFIRKYQKEASAFGSQRKLSETRCAETALGNLARACGCEEPERFARRMECLQFDSFADWFSGVEDGEFLYRILIDGDGFPSLEASKHGKILKTVPSGAKKTQTAQTATQNVKLLREMHRRFRTDLEQAMVRRETYSGAELKTLHKVPVFAPMLGRLLYVREGKTIEYSDEISDNDILYIAHPHDLTLENSWLYWQNYVCEKQIKQPFKQVFREYYSPTPDELRGANVSQRYAGAQISARKAAALASSRGWSVNDGIYRIFYKEKIKAELYAGFTFFTPADTEPPVIEQVVFTNCETGAAVNISSVPPVLFSEVMRDADLLVCAAACGLSDPEASASSVEMRASLIKALSPLLGINATVDGRYAVVKGSYGEYSVHLGSGSVQMKGRGAIAIAPVHPGGRGRLFLPFADDDPKTSEIISKIVLLSQDGKIKDPIILKQIKAYCGQQQRG